MERKLTPHLRGWDVSNLNIWAGTIRYKGEEEIRLWQTHIYLYARV